MSKKKSEKADLRGENSPKSGENSPVATPLKISILSGEFETIVIDPPWPMKIERDVRPNQVEFDYSRSRCAIAQANGCHKAAQAAIDAHFGRIDDDALAHKLFTAESDALNVLAETPCASDTEFLEKLRYLLAHETRICERPPDGRQDFGSILVAVDRHFNVDRDFDQIPIGERGEDWGSA